MNFNQVFWKSVTYDNPKNHENHPISTKYVFEKTIIGVKMTTPISTFRVKIFIRNFGRN